MPLTANQIRCLLAVHSLARTREDVASKDVAHRLGVTRPSAHKALAALASKGLIEKEPYAAARLTGQGRALAERLAARAHALQALFSQCFGLSQDESALAATLMMCALGEESLERLEQWRP